MTPVEQYAAEHLRRAWLALYTKATPEEIEHDLARIPVTSLDDEIGNMHATIHLREEAPTWRPREGP